MEKFTRKELKTDRFAEQIGRTVEYMAAHRRQATLYGAAALTVVLLGIGYSLYSKYQYGVRQEALREAMRVQQAAVGGAPTELIPSFPTLQEKNTALVKAFTDIATRYSGSEEAAIAHFYLGAHAADQGQLAEAEKHFKEVQGSGEDAYASLAKLSLARIYDSQGKPADAEKLLRSLIEKPTIVVSKEQATIALGRVLADSNPAEARKLLEPLRTERSAVSRAALGILSEIPAK